MFSRFLALSKSLRPSGILDILRMCFGENERRKDLIASRYNDASEIAVRSSSSSNFSSLGKRSIFRSSLGFTMVEIMIVIAILGILAAAIMPLSGYYMMRARDLARVVDTHNLEKVLMMYEMDYGIFPAHELGCYPHNSIKSYLRKTYISPRGNGYDEGCGSSGMYGYGVSTDGHTALLMAMMERSRGGNYTGSTLGMTGSLTPLGDSNAMNTRKGDGNIYIVKIGGGSGTNTPVPPVPVVTDGDCSTVSGLCLAGSPSGYSAPVCGGSRTWTCKGQNGGIDKSCSIINTVCPANVTATFDANGGTGHSPTIITVAYNTAIGALPSNPNRIGYSFSGWYTDPTEGTQISVSTTMTSNTTYYAQWICNADGYDEPMCTDVGQAYVASSTRPGCNGPDKVFCVCVGKAQTWSMCNAGSNMTNPTWSETYAFFQWGINDGWYRPGHWTTYPDRTSIFIGPFTYIPWGGGVSDTFLSLGSPSAMQGPCPTGYHVPTITEWKYAIAFGQKFTTGTNSCEGSHSAYIGPNGTIYDNGNTGNDNGNTGNHNSYYWSSTSGMAIKSAHCSGANMNSFANEFPTLNGTPGGISIVTMPNSNGLTVRCMKNTK